MRKHNYKKNRAKRDVSYSKSYQLLKAVGEQTLRELFKDAGMYKVAEAVSVLLGHQVSPYVVRHCRKVYGLGAE